MMTLLSPLRVLHIITQSRPLGGAQQNTLALLTRLDRHRFESHLACGLGGPLIDAARDNGVPVTVLPTLDNPLRPLADARALAGMIALCRRGRFDIVHTHSTKAGVLGRLAAAMCRVPVVVHTIHAAPFHQGQSAIMRAATRWAERAAARWCRRLIAVGDEVGEEFARAGICAPDKIRTIRSGIDFSRFDAPAERAEIRRQLGIAPGEPVVGAVGHMRPAKGYPYLLEAVVLLRRRFPALRLLVAGGGELLDEITRRARALAMDDGCLFLGHRDDVPQLLRAMDVFAQASLWEGVPRAVQEAMYVGLPVVATDVNGTSEVVEHGATGLLVPPGDAPALAQAIGDLLAEPAAAARMGQAARRRISDEFSIERTVHKTQALYLELLDEARAASVPRTEALRVRHLRHP
jgi:glycosyltransferase involved in cell wall biosynthesis